MSDFDQTSLHDELEVKVIALLTGELAETEADELENILAINPELAAFRDRMAELMGELHQARDEIAPASGEPPRQLSEERRARIFGDASVLQPKVKSKRIWISPAFWGVAASVAMIFSFGILGSIKFTQSILREEHVFEAVTLSPAPQAEPEYTVNMRQRSDTTPPPRPATITVNNPSVLDIPALNIDVNVDESAVYGRGSGGFGGGLAGVRGMKPKEGREEKEISGTDSYHIDAIELGDGLLNDFVPVEIPKERIEGTPQPIKSLPNLERAATEAPRMVVAKEQFQSTWRMLKEDAGGSKAPARELADNIAGARETAVGYDAYGYSGEVRDNKKDNANSLFQNPTSDRTSGSRSEVEEHDHAKPASGPVDAFAAPAPTSKPMDLGLALEKQKSEVAKLSKLGRAHLLNGDYDAAADAFDDISGMDPNNAEAKLFASRIDSIQAEKGQVKSREEMLRQVDQSWERPKVFDSEADESEVKTITITAGTPQIFTIAPSSGSEVAMADASSPYQSKLNDIVIPQVNFSGMPLSQVVETLNELSVAYDPEQKGVQLEYQPVDGHDPKVNISLRNLNLDRILQFVTQQVNYSYDVGSDAISIQASDSLAGVSNMVTEYFPVSRETVARLAGYTNDDISSSGVSETQALQSFFQNAGINPELPGTSLAFDGEKLIVTQTRRNVERMRTILRHYGDKYKAEKAAETVRLTPKPEKLAAEEPFSTFSLNISDVSFKLAQAALQNSRVPPSSQIRTEEFVNSFDYGDPVPRPEEPVSLNWEIAQHPYEHDRQVVRFSIQTQASGRESGQPLNLSLLVDNSGSMQRPDRQAILQNSLQTLQEKLTPQDKLNVILFARQPKLIAEAQSSASQKAAVETALAYRPDGGTNLEAGLMAAYESARRNYLPEGGNRVILMTDGAANLGNVNAGELAEFVIEQRKQGIALDAYGIGWDDYNDALLEEITRNGDGRYAFLNSAEDAGEDFSEKLAGTLRVAAANVKVQIEWNPLRVKRYRQIGYDLHQLKKEDFRDNTVDAAEIGEAESGTALYVLQIDEDPDIIGGLGTLRVRYQDPSSGLFKELSWPLTMPRQVKAANAATPSMRLALTSALLGERLANSPYASGYDLRDLYNMTSGLPEAFPNQPRVAEMQTMILQASELYGDNK